jgi:hypothetical protein
MNKYVSQSYLNGYRSDKERYCQNTRVEITIYNPLHRYNV